ncbi:MAG: hypothetical protein SFX74_06365 [Fimbriimonadaceae bacterium]|nr:hypothetical protein [Fimbriimonadaceae bacterium]
MALFLLACVAPSVNAFYIGHSLESDIPDMVMALAGSSFQFKEQNIPGAPLGWQWQEANRKSTFEPQFQAVYTRGITSATTDLVLIDSVPRGEPESLRDSIEYTTRFVKFARERNPRVRVFYYEPWHHLTSGTPQRDKDDRASPSRELRWRERLRADRPKWDSVVKAINAALPGGTPVRIIPAGTALGQLDDAISAGRVPGLARIRQVFDDDIHLSPLGKYFVACLHYRALFGQPATGRPYEIRNRWGVPYWDTKDWAGKTWPKPSAATVGAIQRIADSVTLPM